MNAIGMVQVKSAEEVTREELARNEERDRTDNAVADVITSLGQYIDRRWADAKRVKESIETEMLECLRQCRGEYSPSKLAEIRQVEQPEIWMNITDTKCRNAVAWIKDILFQPTGRMFGIEPTPVPELPEEIASKVETSVVQTFISEAVMYAQQTGQMVNPEQLREMMVQKADEIKDHVKKEIVRISKRLSEDIEDHIDDDWLQGGYYEAINALIDDVVRLKAGVLKGAIFRKIKVKRTVVGADGKLSKQVEEKIIPQYERRSPFCIFPSPRSVDVNSGDLFDVIKLRPKDLYDLIGVSGYKEKELRDVLREAQTGGINNKWLGLSQTALEAIGEDNPQTSSGQYPEENIYALEFWGEIPGNLLKEWGLENVTDEEADYSCCVWKIGTHIIKAMLNYDPLGEKPFFKTSFQNVNDSFWGGSVPELIADCQQVCNACARSILSNVAIGALPQIGLNVDRLEPGASRKIWPAKVWPMTSEEMASGEKPIEFWQPVMVTEKLANMYAMFSKIADEHSGVPAYAHGDSQVGGAGNTASGLNMLITQAARGIKAVIRNIDNDIIIPSARSHYDYLIDNSDVFGLVGDYNIIAKGTSALIAQEQQATRKIEFLGQTANPVDIQIIGAENRKKMLFDVAKSLGIEIDETDIQPQQQPQMQGSAPPPNPQALDAAGNPAQGVDTRQFNPEARAAGGEVRAGKPYKVGELGEELFVPGKDGFIVPNSQLNPNSFLPMVQQINPDMLPLTLRGAVSGAMMAENKTPINTDDLHEPGTGYVKQAEDIVRERKKMYDDIEKMLDEGAPKKQKEPKKDKS
jgi:hypothetical protein